ncbi:MAG: cell division protein ZapA [Bdellovibrio sp.]
MKSPSGSSPQRTYELNFAGLSYRLRSSHDEATVQQLAQMVDQKMTQALASLKNASYQHAAVLAALNIAEELIILRKRAQEGLDYLEKRTQKILDTQAPTSSYSKGKNVNHGSSHEGEASPAL